MKADKAWLSFTVLIALVAGCNPVTTYEKPARAFCDGWSIAMGGVSYYLQGRNSPQPPDEDIKPDPQAKCRVCGGTGKVGDGRVEVDCQDCGGDGVIDGDEAGMTPVVDEEPYNPPEQPEEDKTAQEPAQAPVLYYEPRVYTPRRVGLLRRIFRCR